jgi:hypothetical protein
MGLRDGLKAGMVRPAAVPATRAVVNGGVVQEKV